MSGAGLSRFSGRLARTVWSVELPEVYRRAVERLCDLLPLRAVNWALTGSVAHRIQGVDVACGDVDVQTDEEAVYDVARRLDQWMVDPVVIRESETMRSHFGRAVFEDLGVDVEIMGAVQKRRSGGPWSAPTDPAVHRRVVSVGPMQVPVLSLKYEADAYEAIGRAERAKLLRDLL